MSNNQEIELLKFGLKPSIVEELDKLAKSPTELAEEVHEKIAKLELDEYSLLCWASQILAAHSVTDMTFLRQGAVLINRDLHLAHYIRLANKKVES